LKVIVVEDEPNSLMGMQKVIESLEMDLTLFTSRFAEDAIDIIVKHRPELIVTDIMLPGMTGLDMIEQFAEESYYPKVIVVSGHNDFEYARRSIRFGVVDYLLKPFDTEEFADKIRNSLMIIKQEKDLSNQMKQQKAYAQIGTRLMRDNYLVDFCLKRTPLEEHIYQRLGLWNLQWLADQPYSVIIIDTKGFPDGKPVGRNSSLQTFAIGNILNEMLTDQSMTIFFQDPKSRWIIITGCECTQELIYSIIENVVNYQKIELAIGYSSTKSLFEDIKTAYDEALKMFRVHSLSGDMDILMNAMTTKKEYPSPDQLASMICEGDEQSIRQAVHQFMLQMMLEEGIQRREDIIRSGLNYLSNIHESLSEKANKELEEIPMSVWEAFDECKTIEDYELVLYEYLKSMSQELYTPKTNAMIDRAIKMIQSSYAEDITLTSIAESLSMHPVWLSQLFKKETGQTFTEYLTEIRIVKAKALLRETSMKVYEIASAVGYNDLQYFGSLFKKKTGQTPKECRYGK